MRKSLFVFLGIVAILSLDACKKSKPSTYGTMTAIIGSGYFNGTNCVAQHANATLSPYSLSIYGGFFTGLSPSLPNINIILNNYSGLGTYTIDNATNIATIDSGISPLVATSGTVIIYAIAGNISGSFNFVTVDSTKVTSGSFTTQAPTH